LAKTKSAAYTAAEAKLKPPVEAARKELSAAAVRAGVKR
jgi:hypothetical protein